MPAIRARQGNRTRGTARPSSVGLLIAVGLLLILGGCREEGPAERAGRQLDEAVEEARERTQETLDDLGHEVDEAVEEGERAVRKLRDGDE
jgi:hypothetical protein